MIELGWGQCILYILESQTKKIQIFQVGCLVLVTPRIQTRHEPGTQSVHHIPDNDNNFDKADILLLFYYLLSL